MTDSELLELAAKAAGIDLKWAYGWSHNNSERGCPVWHPLTDDGDALRLAVKLKLRGLFPTGGFFVGYVDGDPYTATRRAIVLAAAELGKEL